MGLYRFSQSDIVGSSISGIVMTGYIFHYVVACVEVDELSQRICGGIVYDIYVFCPVTQESVKTLSEFSPGSVVCDN